MTITHIKSDKEFKEIITTGNSIIMVHKTGCPYCEKAMPWVEECSNKSKSETKICTVNRDDIPKTMKLFQVQMYPTFLQIKNGKIIETFFGDTVEDKVKAFVNKTF